MMKKIDGLAPSGSLQLESLEEWFRDRTNYSHHQRPHRPDINDVSLSTYGLRQRSGDLVRHSGKGSRGRHVFKHSRFYKTRLHSHDMNAEAKHPIAKSRQIRRKSRFCTSIDIVALTATFTRDRANPDDDSPSPF
jgi:hypothetical protein